MLTIDDPRPEILLHPSIPTSLFGVNPRTIKGKQWWDIERKLAYAKHGFCCMACGSVKESEWNISRNVLHAHESYDINFETGCVRLKEIVALCPICHDFIHIRRIGELFDKGLVDDEYCYLVINRGLQVLGINELPKQPDYDKYDWNHFYLELDGVKHYSKFKDKEELMKHYKGEETDAITN